MISLIFFSLTAAITFLTFVTILGLFFKWDIGFPAIRKFDLTGWYSFYPAFLFQVFWWVHKYGEYLK